MSTQEIVSLGSWTANRIGPQGHRLLCSLFILLFQCSQKFLNLKRAIGSLTLIQRLLLPKRSLAWAGLADKGREKRSLQCVVEQRPANQDHVTRQQMSSSGVRLQTSGRHTASLQGSAIQASSFQNSNLPTSRKDKTKGSCHGRQSWQNDANTEDRVTTISSS